MASWIASEVIELPDTSPSQTFVSPSCGLVHASCNLRQSLVPQKETFPNDDGSDGSTDERDLQQLYLLDRCSSPVSPVSTMSSPGSSASLKSFTYHQFSTVQETTTCPAPAPAAPAQIAPPSTLKLPRRIVAAESSTSASRGTAGLYPSSPHTAPTVTLRATLASMFSPSTAARKSTLSTPSVISPCGKPQRSTRRKNPFMTCVQETCTKSRSARNPRRTIIDQDALVARHRFVCQHAYKNFMEHLISRTAFMHIVRESGRGSNILDPFAATFFEGGAAAAGEMLCPSSPFVCGSSLHEEERCSSPSSTEAKLLFNRKAQETVCRALWNA